MNLVSLSKRLAVALRHEPGRFGLTLDADGWAPLADVAAGLGVSVEDVTAAVALPGKRRYEIDGDRVRARYGHSTPDRIEHVPAVPPEVLFHGTSATVVPTILRDGLRPMARQYVHLSADRATARQVGSRRRGEVALLVVDAAAAHRAGVAFYDAGRGVWLADAVPAAYVAEDAPGTVGG